MRRSDPSVKLRHSAALALVGWYLMAAPRDANSLFLPHAPLKQWVLVKSFDTAEKCEAERNEDILLASRSGYTFYYDTEKRENVGTDAKYVYLCIATDDPRLKSPGQVGEPGEKANACTQEAKQCPDGSYVSRTGPNCEFQACPGEPSLKEK